MLIKHGKAGKRRRNARKLILDAILKYMEKNEGRSPSYREIGEDPEVRIKSPGHIAYHLKALEEDGYLQRGGFKSRSIKVLKHWDGSPLLSPVIAAGPQRAILSAIQNEEQLLPGKAFILPVEGDSMKGDGILSGDLIIVDPEQEIQEGDIVVATHLNATESELGAGTVKRFYNEGKKIRLQPSNDQMEPIYVPASKWNREWRIQGQVIAYIRQLSRSPA